MMVFRALLLDAYRQLSAAKLFWLTLGLSVLVVVLYGSISFNDEGMSMFYGLWELEDTADFKTGSRWARGLYLGIYSSILVPFWLTWIATILALISTCSIFPEFVQGGAIELTLSKPIGRLRLFLMKYAVSLLFVLLQVLAFCVGIFLCVGLRMGEWNWSIFAAIPIVVIFFSYLYSVCVLVGMVTRSGITALLITGVFWMGLWSMQSAEAVLYKIMTDQQVKVETFEKGLIKKETVLAEIKEVSEKDDRIASRQKTINTMKIDIEEAQKLFDKLESWHIPVTWGLTVLPKTGQTIGLLGRWMTDLGGFDIAAIMAGDMRDFEEMEEFDPTSHGARERETSRRMQEEYKSKSHWYVLGTSLLFEGFILFLGGWYFCRKDF